MAPPWRLLLITATTTDLSIVPELPEHVSIFHAKLCTMFVMKHMDALNNTHLYQVNTHLSLFYLLERHLWFARLV